MGLDKLRLITPRRPQPEFFGWVNDELRKRPEERNYVFQFPNPMPFIDPTTRVSLWTKPKIKPFVRIDLQSCVSGGAQPPLTIIETNPNNFQTGYAGLRTLVEFVFGEDSAADLKISRIDCNADVPEVSVDYFRRTLRIPRKRKTGEMGKLQESYSNYGVETFYLGRAPAQLRVYDKVQELKYQRQDISQLPPILTRVEWEFRGKRCPVRYLGELPQLLDIKPFAGIQFLETDRAPYSFKHSPKESVTRFCFDKMVEEMGAHEAVRILNRISGNHFSRNVGRHVTRNDDLNGQIHAAYIRSTKAFFDNRCAEIRHLYRNVNEEEQAVEPMMGRPEPHKHHCGLCHVEIDYVCGCQSQQIPPSRVGYDVVCKACELKLRAGRDIDGVEADGVA